MHTFGIDKHNLCYSTNLFVKIIPNLVNYEMMAMFHKLNHVPKIKLFISPP